MGFYIRKSLRVGPVRFNLSKSGIGTSVGIPGLRLGTGPRGTYVHAGRGGLYYRQYLFTHPRPPGPQQRSPSIPMEPAPSPGDPEAVQISSAAASTISDSSAAELLEEIRTKQALIPFTLIVCIVGLIATVAAWRTNAGLGTTLLIVSVAAAVYAKQLDVQRRTAVVMYDLDPVIEAAFRALYDGIADIRSCQKVWSVSSVSGNNNYKYNAGAAKLLDRRPAVIRDGSVPGLKTNVTVPAIALHSDVLYFLPDHILITNGGGLGAISYRDFRATSTIGRFIEDGPIPRDAQQVGTTWQYLNKNGSPDRRFTNNRQLPILAYQDVLFASETGVRAYLQLSSSHGADRFLGALAGMRQVTASPSPRPTLTQSTAASTTT